MVLRPFIKNTFFAAALLAGMLSTTAHAARFEMRMGIKNLVVSSSAAAAPAPEVPVSPVSNPLALSMSAAVLPAATVGQAYSFNFAPLLSMAGDTLPPLSAVSFSTSSVLPAGLSLSQTGILSGTPTMPNGAGTAVQVIASYYGTSGQRVYTLLIGGQVVQVTMTSAGWSHACGLTPSGGVKCWGNNQYGQLGNNSTTSSLTPVDVQGLSAGVASLHLGARHSCALLTDGKVKCWGANDLGQLGDFTVTNRMVPVAARTANVTQMAAGATHNCAVVSTGGVWCWGDDSFNKIGNSTVGAYATEPKLVTGTGTTASFKVSAGLNHSCYTIVGFAYCWGYGSSGQLGNGTTASQFAPTRVSGLSDAAVIDGGYGNHTCTLTSGGGVKCWGANIYGQLGLGSLTGYSLTPQSVLGLSSGVTKLSVGQFHSCAVQSGVAKCWGRNNYGQIGATGTAEVLTPTAIPGISKTVASVSAGFGSTCVTYTDGNAQCLGLNASGQLGNGTTADSTAPVSLAP